MFNVLLGQFPGVDGFLGTRGSFMLDFVFLAMFAVVPILGWSVMLAKRGRYTLHKRVFAGALRTSVWVDITHGGPGQTVTVTCELLNKEMGVGRFPLRALNTSPDGLRERYGVQCLADGVSERSRFWIAVRDESGRTIHRARADFSDARVATKAAPFR